MRELKYGRGLPKCSVCPQLYLCPYLPGLTLLADDKINVTQNLKFVSSTVGNIVGGENAG